MIGIDKISGGRFGNRLLQYLNVLQISKSCNVDAFCNEYWEGHMFLQNCISRKCNNQLTLNWRDVEKKNHINQSKIQNCSLDGTVIHNFFYDLAVEHPRNLVKLKKEYLPKFDDGFKTIGVHIRGGDIISADGNNGRELHSLQYYKDSLKYILDHNEIDSIFICTDDLNFSLFIDFVSFAKQNAKKIQIELGPSTKDPSLSHIFDLGVLSECDFLIASSSTYAIIAGLLGKEKKIIHSREWVDKNIPGDKYVKWGNYTNDYPEDYWKKYDEFWIKVEKGGNEFYKPWLIL